MEESELIWSGGKQILWVRNKCEDKDLELSRGDQPGRMAVGGVLCQLLKSGVCYRFGRSGEPHAGQAPSPPLTEIRVCLLLS